MKGRLERSVQAGVISYLSIRNDMIFWRANTGGAKYGKQYVRFGKRGAADIQGVKAEKHIGLSGVPYIVGRFFGIETKREKGGKVSEDQRRWGANIVAAGGLYIVARDMEAVVQGLGPEQVRIEKIPDRVRIYPRGTEGT